MSENGRMCLSLPHAFDFATGLRFWRVVEQENEQRPLFFVYEVLARGKKEH